MAAQKKGIHRKTIQTILVVAMSVMAAVIFTTKDIFALTIADVERSALAKAVLECLPDNETNNVRLRTTVKVGEPMMKIFDQANFSDSKVEVGQWITRSEETKMRCSDIIKKFFSGTIQKDDRLIESVYKSSEGIKELTCGYKLKNADGTTGTEIKWLPNGYYYDEGQQTVHPMINEPKITLRYDMDSNSWIARDTDPLWVKNLERMSLDATPVPYGGSADAACKNILDSSQHYVNYDGWFLLVGDSFGQRYSSVDTSTIFGAEHMSTESSNTLTRINMSSGFSGLKSAISNEYLGRNDATNLPEGKYLIYGRMLFNGDNGFSIGCGGVSALDNQDNRNALKDPEGQYKWDLESAQVKPTVGYINNLPQNLITKFSVDNPSISTVTPLGDSGAVTCAEMISSSFSAGIHINVSNNAEIVKAVEEYINVFNPQNNDPTTAPIEGLDAGAVSDDACYKHAGSLGWIICPIINGLHNLVTKIYGMVEPMIAVHETVIDDIGNESGGVYSAWVQFRDLANIAFAVFFMIIIFSQLTGIGIDNYGIKKLLPKVIVTAILVNLSYFIVGVLVDLSNIIGNGLQGLFEHLKIVEAAGGRETISFEKITAALVTGIGTMAGVWLVTSWGLIIPILIYLISSTISLFFAWIVLGLRQAVVIILIAVSPIALVLLALPNTEKYFKKYLDILKGVLVVYPVVGGLIGAGTFASALLMQGSTHSFTMTIIAGLLCVVPYLLIPSLTRKSLDAMGNIGSRLSNLGHNASRRLDSALNKTETAKDLSEGIQSGVSKAWLATHRRTAERVRNGSASRHQANQYKRHSALANSRETDRINARGAQVQYERLSSKDGFDAAMASISNKERETSISDQDTLFSDRGVYDDDSKFAAEVYNAIRNDDDIKLEALMRKAAKGSDNQRGALISSMDRALKQGSVSEKIARAYGSHVTTNDPYKAKDRSAFEQGAALLNSINKGTYNNGGASFTRSNYTANGFKKGKITADQIFKMDDNELNAIRDSLGSMSARDKNEVVSAMMNARKIKDEDKNNKYDYVQKSTMDLIDQIIGNNSIVIPHNNPTPPQNNNPTPPAPNILPFPGNPNP